VLTPENQTDLLADNRVDVADDGLGDQVGVEERLGDPRGAVVGLVDEIEQGVLAFLFRPGIGGIPPVHEIAGVRCERRPQRVTRDVGGGRAGPSRHEDHGGGERQHDADDGPDGASTS
jgi:hypothetical protein